jgi:phosphohistidine phosphatase
MLTLLLLRHAKSSWDVPALADYDRPLAKRGLKAAPRMGAEIATLGLRPDLVLCSGAKRTRETLGLVLDALGTPFPQVVYDDEIYMAPPTGIMQILRRQAADLANVMVVGHNPGLEELAELLVGRGDDGLRETLEEKFPTCALAVITFAVDSWADIAPGTGTLVHFLTPARLA